MIKIVDCFPFFNEIELLELRVRMLEHHVDQFVISEANRTHSGKPKDFILKKLIVELGLPVEKIRVLEVDLYAEEAQTPAYIDICHATSAKSQDDAISWTRERLQRDAISKYIDEYSDDTVFIMSDCDEIIDPTVVEFLTTTARENTNVVIRVPLRLLESRADLEVTNQDGESVSWDESMLLCMKHHIKTTDITLLKANKLPNEFCPWPGLFVHQDGKRIENLGWHFTWMGDNDRKLYKSQSFIHHSNLNVVNNVSQETLGVLSSQLDTEISTEKKYHLTKIDHSLLPKKIFELPHVEKFLLNPQEENKMNVSGIVNCFSYTGEKELLELRIKLLHDWVDQFIITEGDHSFSGTSRPYSCIKALDELGIPKDKIKVIEVRLPDSSKESNSSAREELLRDAAKEHIPLGSICYITDANEIPDPLFFEYYIGVLKRNPEAIIRVPLAHLSGRADLQLTDDDGKEFQHVNSYLYDTDQFKNNSLSSMRKLKSVPSLYLKDNGRIDNAGWKFEWMGSREQRKDLYRASLEYSKHSTLGRRLRLEFLDDYTPSKGSVDAISSKGQSLAEYDPNQLPEIIKNIPKFKDFLLPEQSAIKNQKPLIFDDLCLPYLKLNNNADNVVFIVENFYTDPYAVREFAMNQDFDDNPDHYGYVGRRTRKQFFPPGLKERFEEIIGEPITRWEEYGMNGRFQWNTAGQPLVYHCDEQKWAGLIYLTPDAPYQAGTRLLANKKNRVRHNKDPKIMEAFTQETFLDGTPFETVDHVGNVFNRLVIYKGGMIHAASEYFGWNIENARLWHMFFFD